MQKASMNDFVLLIKRDTLENFTFENPILRDRELALAYKGKKAIYKLGDGRTSWNDLKPVTKIKDIIPCFRIYSGNKKASICIQPGLLDEKE